MAGKKKLLGLAVLISALAAFGKRLIGKKSAEEEAAEVEVETEVAAED